MESDLNKDTTLKSKISLVVVVFAGDYPRLCGALWRLD